MNESHSQKANKPASSASDPHSHKPGSTRRGRNKHSHSEQHPDTKNLRTPSDTGEGLDAEDNGAGSPKVEFSAGLPSRIASGQLSQLFNFHAQTDEDIRSEEQAVLRQMDIDRIVTSIRLLGYEVNQAPGFSPSPDIQAVLGAFNTAPGVLQGPAATFFHTNADPLERLTALVISMHQELDILMPKLAPADHPYHDALRWKEDIALGLLTRVSPALGRLVERVTGQVGGVLQQHQGGVRFFVGQGQQGRPSAGAR
ncbi:hypothetical protein LTR85_004168 [Meristemomyces frigidus]|nr:hypothetical protein LTR85_004168 [Meristemomyces frigidus]